ncbi:MAG: hypothetical protein QOG53_1173 [Frankiales bacterium]|jgi:hypothetical protein|nr:hypothetical protein [Frankiales bacterium]
MTVTSEEPARIRLLPAPRTDPPYDDERDLEPLVTMSAGAVQGALALAFTLPSGLPAVPSPPRPLTPLRVVPDSHRTGIDDEDPDDPIVAPLITSRAELPDPRPFAGRLTQAIVEVVSGARPAAQLARWTSRAVYDDIAGRVTRLARAGAPGLRRIITGSVRSVHVNEPLDGIAEVCAIVQRGGRTVAVALRLEGLDGRWMCTELTFV